MKNIIILFLFLNIGCKKSNKQVLNNKTTTVDTIIEVIKKPTVSDIEFLNFIDESLIFQEKYGNDFATYAFVCDGTKDKINFSGTIYLMPVKKDYANWSSAEYREKIIDSINNYFSINEIHSRYNLLAQITHEEYFLPLKEWIDNPCVYYKENRKVVIYSSKKGSLKWMKMFETKDVNKIDELVSKTKN